MTTPHDPDQGNIADTGMFQRFVAAEAELENKEASRHSKSALWTAIIAMAVIIVIAIVVWLLTR